MPPLMNIAANMGRPSLLVIAMAPPYPRLHPPIHDSTLTSRRPPGTLTSNDTSPGPPSSHVGEHSHRCSPSLLRPPGREVLQFSDPDQRTGTRHAPAASATTEDAVRE